MSFERRIANIDFNCDMQAVEPRMQLFGYIDMISRYISAQQRAVMSSQAFPGLCAGVAKLTLAILRHRFDDAVTVAHLRRLLTAFSAMKEDSHDHSGVGRPQKRKDICSCFL